MSTTPAGEFRAFVRRHHPDVGGDPDVFRRGLAAFRAGRSPFEAVPGPDGDRVGGHVGGHDGAGVHGGSRWSIADDDPRLDAPIVAVSGHVVPRTLRAGRRWLGRAPLNPVRTRRVV